jgi:hypothetical protein
MLGGMIVGAAVLLFFGAVWLLVGLYTGRYSPGWLRTALLLAGLALAASIGVLTSRASHPTHIAPQPKAEQTTAGRQMGSRFGLIVGVEGTAIMLVVLLLNATHHSDYIVCAIAMIVGLHFLPLASLFGAFVYYATGLLGCVIGIAGCFVPQPVLRQRVVGLSFGLLLWTTAAVIVAQGFILAGSS